MTSLPVSNITNIQSQTAGVSLSVSGSAFRTINSFLQLSFVGTKIKHDKEICKLLLCKLMSILPICIFFTI